MRKLEKYEENGRNYEGLNVYLWLYLMIFVPISS
jgi:hypothetical protein